MFFAFHKGEIAEFLPTIKKIELLFLNVEDDSESVAAAVVGALISIADLRDDLLWYLERKTVNRKRARKTQRNNTSGSKGVTFNKSAGKWQAKIGSGSGRAKHLGYFETMDQAVAARAVAEAEMWGLRR
jgi:hypothetical protein